MTAAVLTIRVMPALADVALGEQERELLDRFVAALRVEYGGDLDAVWLYGSRARGERSHDESDIDVLVITGGERDDERLIPILRRVLDELRNPRVLVDPRQRSRTWVEGRGAIDSFFHARRRPRQGRALQPLVSPRSAELLERAREGVASAQTLIEAGHAATAVSTAYYAMGRRSVRLKDPFLSRGRTSIGTRAVGGEVDRVGRPAELDDAGPRQRT